MVHKADLCAHKNNRATFLLIRCLTCVDAVAPTLSQPLQEHYHEQEA